MNEYCPTTGKISYPDRRSAKKANAAMRAKRGSLNVYRCERCNLWHLGRKRTETGHKHVDRAMFRG